MHEAVLLKLHTDFAQGWALIQVNFDPIQESRGWVLFHETTVIATPWQQIQSTKSADLIGHSKFLPWRQIDAAAWPDTFFLWRVLLARLNSLTPNWFISSWDHCFQLPYFLNQMPWLLFFVLFTLVWLLFEGSYHLRRVHSVGKPVVIDDSWIGHIQAILLDFGIQSYHTTG